MLLCHLSCLLVIPYNPPLFPHPLLHIPLEVDLLDHCSQPIPLLPLILRHRLFHPLPTIIRLLPPTSLLLFPLRLKGELLPLLIDSRALTSLLIIRFIVVH